MNLLFHDRSFFKLVTVTTCPMRGSNPPTTGLEAAVADLVGRYIIKLFYKDQLDASSKTPSVFLPLDLLPLAVCNRLIRPMSGNTGLSDLYSEYLLQH